jgi:RHS repeat-associated protein
MTYNDWGQVLMQIDPLGNTVTNTYDAWGKPLTSHDNLSGYLTYKYEKQNFITTVTKHSPDGGVESTIVNAKGETVLVRTKAFNTNQYIEKGVTYDILGRKTAESEPYLNTETPKWNTIEYNESVFPPIGTATAFNGKKVETKVEGLTTIMTELNGYNRVTKKTTDALGNVIESEDKGGTILFTYNAAGQNLMSKYGANEVKTTYDKWGRKESFDDPSNGKYEYTYHGFGQLKRETSRKGYKEYIYNNSGQLISQTERSIDGTSTNKNITFTYDNKGRITNRQGTSNGKPYSSYINYDAQGRSIASGENSNNRYFLKKNVIYDDKGRVTSYEKGMYSGGTYTAATIENIYSGWRGDLYQVKDKTTQKVLWQLDAVKANGQVLNAKLGAISIGNTYDNNNFLTNVWHYQEQGQVPIFVLSLGYTFDAIKNELKKRTRAGFGIAIEDFVYDDNNRLLNWTNPKTGLLSNNLYDEKGRITTNDQLGKVNFNNPQKVYQATSIEPNTTLPQHWPDKETILQKITYNENNDPIYLDGKNGDYAFEYGLNESRQAMHYGGNFDPALASQQAKFSKYYSEDGSYEVILDRTTGKEKHLMYIGGSPYESDIVLLKEFVDATTKYVFLHKDYLGTILAITSDTGVVLEQRHFDAWGVFTHFSGIYGATTPPLGAGGLLIDRGYTSHEHLQDVGIIHMNGRLYDPLMRRFLNADENIQDPYNTQNYNKYGYAMNNPLLFNDPSGEIIFLGIAMALVVKAMIIGAAVGLASYTLGLALTGNMWRFSAGGALKAMFFGAVSGAVTCGIGSMFSVAKEGVQGVMEATKLATALGGTGSLGVVIVQGACHAVAQGALSMMQGGKFLTGAAAGFLGHLGGEAWGASMKGLGLDQFAGSTGGIITFGALSGGVGAELTGGNFWTGAVTGGIVAGLNTALHNGDDNENVDQEGKRATKESLGIKNGDTKEIMIDKIFKNMRKGDYILGEDLTFMPESASKFIKKITYIGKNKFNIDGKIGTFKIGILPVKINPFENNSSMIITKTKSGYRANVYGYTKTAKIGNAASTVYINNNSILENVNGVYKIPN